MSRSTTLGQAGAPTPSAAPPDRPVAGPSPLPRWQTRLAGALAAAVALAVGELVSGLWGKDQSLIASVGSSFVDRFAGLLKGIAVSLFGTNDKPALIVGIVVISLMAGAALGTATAARRWAGAAGFAAFGLVGVIAGVTDPQASAGLAVAAAIAATLAGIATLWALLGVARTGTSLPILTTQTARRPRSGVASSHPTADPHDAPAESPTDPAHSRRSFFAWAGAAGAFAAGAAVVARAAGGPSRAELARGAVKLPVAATRVPALPAINQVSADAPMGVVGLTPYYVPNADFYRIDTALLVPQVDPASWRLKVGGMVDRPFELTFDELLAMPQVEEAVTLMCVSNEVGGDLVGNARWQGVPLAAILERAGVQAGASQIVGRSIDGWTGGFPAAVATDGRVAMIAVGMNGEPLPLDHGFPARLVVSGLYGYVSATKWLTDITLTTWAGFDGYWVPRGWAKEGPIKTESRIDVPRRRDPLSAGTIKIAGVAWAPTRGISKVEVQIDDGPWRAARLGDAVSNHTWVQWVFDWDAAPGDYRIRCRATDGRGETQTATDAPPDPDGASGYPLRLITVRA